MSARELLFNQNSNWKTFGLNSTVTNPTVIQHLIEKTEKNFDLIMISEYLPESLVLVQTDLNLTLEDVSYFSKNVAVHKRVVSARYTKLANKWQYLDHALYDHFNKTLWRKIEKFGVERMERAVADLKQLNMKKSKNCIKNRVPVSKLEVQFRDYVPPGVKLDGIKLYRNASAEW